MRIALYSLFLLLLFPSCEIEYTQYDNEEVEGIPTAVLYNVRSLEVRDNYPLILFEADEAVIWQKRLETELKNFTFEEYRRSGEISNKGWADYLLLDNSNNAYIRGNIQGESITVDGSLSASELNWEHDKRLLKAVGATTVQIELANGTVLAGYGFESDFYNRTTTYASRVEGVLSTND